MGDRGGLSRRDRDPSVLRFRSTTLTKEMFLNNLYGGMDEPEIKIIDVFICKLRKKLANASDGKDYIETVWGRGYVLREPTEEEARVYA
jgi:two-component system, cell cycle response regulator CtrA